MTAHLPILPIVWPFATAVLLLLMFRRRVAWQRRISLLSVVGLLGIDIVLAGQLADGSVAVYRLGNWETPFGIVLMADRLSSLMLLLASVTGLATLAFAVCDRPTMSERERFHFYPLFQFILMGVNGSFLTGDLFNLFVWYEVTLISTYCLLTLGSEARQLRVGVPFIGLNLLASTLFLTAVGLLYGVTGTLNMAHLSEVTQSLGGSAQAVMLSVAVLLLVVFGVKAALFPLYFWLPDGYPAPPVAVSAFFGGIATKVGVYSMMRVFPLVFAGEREMVGEGLMLLGVLSMVIGVLGAVCQTELRRLLSFHIVSQIGYLVFGLGLFTETGVAAAIFYMIHYTLVKCALFLAAGLMERITGENDLKRIGGLQESAPLLATLFFIGGLSLAGMPPWSGFFAKLVIVMAGFSADRYLYAAIAVGTGFFTLFSMMKIWRLGFWGEARGARHRLRPALYAGVILLVSFSVVLAAAFQPINQFARATAAQLLDPGNYTGPCWGTGGDAVMFGHLMFHVLLATLWCLLVQDFSAASFLVGFIASGLTLVLLRQMTGEARFFHKVSVFLRLILFFIYELVIANLQVAWLILRPRLRLRSAFIRLPIELKTDLAITCLANMISLTPGTISVDVADDRASLVVHCLNVTDIAATKRTIKQRFEAQLKELEQP